MIRKRWVPVRRAAPFSEFYSLQAKQRLTTLEYSMIALESASNKSISALEVADNKAPQILPGKT